MPDGFTGPGKGDIEPQPLAAARWDWTQVRRVLVVRLRSIGDTVLATPALHALRRFLPQARIDILLEDWVAPVLQDLPDVDRVWTVARGRTSARLQIARELRRERYDVAYNLHGGTTATLLMRAAGARRRIGFDTYQYQSLLTDAAPPSAQLWGRTPTHSAEQQLALVGWTGIPVTDRPPSRLAVSESARASLSAKLAAHDFSLDRPFALIHPAAAFATKQWAAENFARIAEILHEKGLRPFALAAPSESSVLAAVQAAACIDVAGTTDLTLPEVIALASQARIFIGNDSGLAHLAAARQTPQVVIFGSSNIAHWRPWTNAPHEIVREYLPCQPCPGYECREFGTPECIRRVSVTQVEAALERVLADSSPTL